MIGCLVVEMTPKLLHQELTRPGFGPEAQSPVETPSLELGRGLKYLI
jgi:hypothetical protein